MAALKGLSVTAFYAIHVLWGCIGLNTPLFNASVFVARWAPFRDERSPQAAGVLQ